MQRSNHDTMRLLLSDKFICEMLTGWAYSLTLLYRADAVDRSSCKKAAHTQVSYIWKWKLWQASQYLFCICVSSVSCVYLLFNSVILKVNVSVDTGGDHLLSIINYLLRSCLKMLEA